MKHTLKKASQPRRCEAFLLHGYSHEFFAHYRYLFIIKTFAMENKILKEVRLLRWYAITLTAVLVLFIIFSFTGKNSKPHFEEIDVERINIVEKNGQLKMVISNKQRQHPGMANGKNFPKRERSAGMIFFNSDGDECGGLIYDGNAKGESGMVYSVDQQKNDQIMQLNYSEYKKDGKNKRSYGLKMWDRKDEFPMDRQIAVIDSLKRLKNDSIYNAIMQKMVDNGDWGLERFFAGKDWNGNVGLFIRDAKGKPRIKIYVDKDNNPKLEFYDEKGGLVPVK
jgi:hypothetical protein